MPSNLTSISFPASPALNQTYTYGNQTYQWNGTEWVVSYDSNSIPIGAVTLSGNQTITGVKTFSDNIVASSGITGNVTGTIQTAAQPNITSLGTLTSAVISGNLTIDTNTLFVNSSNDRVGIGTTNPTTTLDVNGTTNITGTLTAGGNTWPQCIQTHVDYRVTYQNAAQGAASQVNIAALNTTITPRSATSKILVNFSISYESYNDRLFRLYRNINGVRTEIASARPVSDPLQYNDPNFVARWGFKSADYDVDQGSTMMNQHMMYLDSPNTTQPVTYELWTYASELPNPAALWSYLVLNATFNQNSQSVAHELATSQCILQEYFA